MRLLRVIAAGVILAVTSSSSSFAQGFVQHGPKLFGTSAFGQRYHGTSVALSADGNTAIVGEPAISFLNDGGAWIHARTNGGWHRQGPKLVGTGGAVLSQGESVAISGDGNTAVVAGPADNGDTGAIWIFVRSGSTWTQQGSKLVGSGGPSVAVQGRSAAISADGNTVLFGGYNSSGGAEYVFTRSGGVWTQQGPALLSGRAPGTPGGGGFGQSVALSADGNTAVVGEPGDGDAWVFTRSGSTWTRLAAALVAPDPTGEATFGSDVAISGDGLTIAIGDVQADGLAGAVWTFVHSGATFSPFGNKITGNGQLHGNAVALSGDGSVLLDGHLGPTGMNRSSAYTRTVSGWSPFGQALVGNTLWGDLTGPMGVSPVTSVSLSADGNTALVGSPSDNDRVGAAWPFTRVQPALPSHATADFDGDHRADATLFKSNGDWTTLTSASGYTSSSTVNWSAAGYVPVRGDFDGDGRQDPALYNPQLARWRIALSSSNFTSSIDMTWGTPGDTPVPGDYDGDNVTDVAVYRQADGMWSIFASRTATAMMLGYGGGPGGSTPIGGQDFDGDFIADLATYHRPTATWSALLSSTAFTTGFVVIWGGPGVMLVPGDYDGDRKTDLGAYRPLTGNWGILTSSSGYTRETGGIWGGPGYLAAPADYDGDARFDLGIYQPSTGNWYVKTSLSGYVSSFTINGAGPGDGVPISSAIPVTRDDLQRASDFDGDTFSEITLYNLTTGLWSSLTSLTGHAGATHRGWGGAGYDPVSGDFDGDSRADLGVYDASNGNWYVLLSGAGFTSSLGQSAGGPGWKPVPADYDGDGRTDIAVYDTTGGRWYIRKSSTNYSTTISILYGGTGYTAVPGDYDWDGKTDIAVYHEATGLWSVLRSSSNYTTGFGKYNGGPGWSPVQADYDGDRQTDFVVYNTGTGQWYGLKSLGSYTTTINLSWGGPGYAPVKGDFDGDGKADLATYVSSSGSWYILLSGANYTTAIGRSWGGAGYMPIPQSP